jgi:DNA-binding beta-propeller fold protein YncE
MLLDTQRSPSRPPSIAPGVARLAAASALALVAAVGAGCAATDPAADVAPLPDGPVLGAGDQRYVWVPDWLALPAGMELGNTHGGIAVDGAGLVYFNTDSEHAIVVVEPDGTFVRAFGAEFAGGLHGLVVHRERDEAGREREVLYVVHTGRAEIAKLSLTGDVLWRRGYPAESGLYQSADQFKPTAIDVAPDGSIYVADGYGFQWVHRVSSQGELLDTFGGPGSAPGTFQVCHGLAIDASGARPHVWVADRENGRLQVFDLDGELVRTVDGDFRRPCCAVPEPTRAGAAPTAFVIADLAGRVTVVDGSGAVLTHLGDNPDESQRANNGVPRELWRDGVFVAPHFATWDARGDLYVLDWVAQGRVSKLVRVRS